MTTDAPSTPPLQHIKKSTISTPMATTPSTHQALQRKVQNVLTLSLYDNEDAQLLQSLQYVSNIFQDHENTSADGKRRKLRGTLEQKSLQTHDHFVFQFAKVNTCLQQLQTVCSQLSQACNAMEQQLDTYKHNTEPFVAQIETLYSQV